MLDKTLNKVASRRMFLSGAALLATGIAVAGCSTTQLANAQAEWASIVGMIQSAVAVGASYVPTIESIAATAASLFGPQYAALVQIGSAAFNQIVTVLENVVAVLNPPAKASLRRKLMSSSPAAPVLVGTTSTGISVAGWKAN